VATGHLISRAPKELILKEHKVLGSATDPDLIAELRQKELPELFDGDFFLPRSMTIRQAGKKSNHGLNYDMRYKRFALENEMMENDAEPIVELYRTEAYPGLIDWHTEIREELHATRTLVNLLGRKIKLMDQFGHDLYMSAYAYKPQSTVADIILRAMELSYNDRRPLFAPMCLAANVHDSILLEYPGKPLERLYEFAGEMKKYMRPELEARGRKFRLNVDVKIGPNWGAMEPLEIPAEYGHEEVPEKGRAYA
jgi:DNA polymerase I-like protein with 3'-5' exonuclease and polymerase domains